MWSAQTQYLRSEKTYVAAHLPVGTLFIRKNHPPAGNIKTETSSVTGAIFSCSLPSCTHIYIYKLLFVYIDPQKAGRYTEKTSVIVGS